jgi:hypothetical protein
MTNRRLPVKPTREGSDKRTAVAGRRVLGRARPEAAFPVPPFAAELPRDYAEVLPT